MIVKPLEGPGTAVASNKTVLYHAFLPHHSRTAKYFLCRLLSRDATEPCV